jgi:tRNA (cytidine/uridine-2'-O-)-methyltransferase
MRLALYEPDIPQNTGALLRLAACLGVPVDIVEPCGFLMDDKRLRRAGLDYLALADVTRHSSWRTYSQAFAEARAGGGSGRLLLATTRGSIPYTEFMFAPGDTLMVGRESAGVPDEVAAAADARLRIPIRAGMRSINVAQAAAMMLGEALRQTGLFPRDPA